MEPIPGEITFVPIPFAQMFSALKRRVDAVVAIGAVRRDR